MYGAQFRNNYPIIYLLTYVQLVKLTILFIILGEIYQLEISEIKRT